MKKTEFNIPNANCAFNQSMLNIALAETSIFWFSLEAAVDCRFSSGIQF